jgi:hypothetical protein
MSIPLPPIPPPLLHLFLVLLLLLLLPTKRRSVHLVDFNYFEGFIQNALTPPPPPPPPPPLPPLAPYTFWTWPLKASALQQSICLGPALAGFRVQIRVQIRVGLSGVFSSWPWPWPQTCGGQQPRARTCTSARLFCAQLLAGQGRPQTPRG